MQTLISVFNDRPSARHAIDQLVDNGFHHHDVHLRLSSDDRIDRTGDDHALTGEREIALDRNVLDSIGHFFVSLFGQDRGEKATGTYGEAYRRGHALVIVDAKDAEQARDAAMILHKAGAIEVENQSLAEDDGQPAHPGVRVYDRDAPSLRELAQHRNLRSDSLLADRSSASGEATKQDREDRAYASPMTHTDRDRPK